MFCFIPAYTVESPRYHDDVTMEWAMLHFKSLRYPSYIAATYFCHTHMTSLSMSPRFMLYYISAMCFLRCICDIFSSSLLFILRCICKMFVSMSLICNCYNNDTLLFFSMFLRCFTVYMVWGYVSTPHFSSLL